MFAISGSLTSTAPQRLTSAEQGVFFTSATFFGYKSFTPSGFPINNTQPVYFGISSAQLPFIVTTGSKVVCDGGRRDSLANYYFQGVSGDGVYVLAYP